MEKVKSFAQVTQRVDGEAWIEMQTIWSQRGSFKPPGRGLASVFCVGPGSK